jgi:hypothetical protein
MNTHTNLSPAWLQLVELCREVNFGHIEEVEFRDGNPVAHGSVVKTVMPGPKKANGPAGSSSFPLRPQWTEVFAVAESAPVVRVRRFEVAHGNPLKLHVETAGGAFDG